MEPLQYDDPRRVGPFHLVGRLGAGGMGRVYLGREPGGRAVAVKVVRSDVLDEEGIFRRRFAREIAAARAVRSPFTVPVVAADPEAGTPWLASAYLPGVTLAQAVAAHGALPVRTLRHLAGGIAVALDDIHGAGLVHRDLKPSNVLLTVDGPRVIDFGIALLSGATTLTRTEQTVGSLGFMSPEQFESADVGPASDVFSCGVVLAYAASARLPFGEGPLAVLVANITMRDPDLEGVPGEFTELVRACLAKRPEDRPSPRELLAGLDNWAEATREHLDEAWLPGDVVHHMVRIATSVLGADGATAPVASGTATNSNPWLRAAADLRLPTADVPADSGRHPRIPPPPRNATPTGHGHGPQPGHAPEPADRIISREGGFVVGALSRVRSRRGVLAGCVAVAAAAALCVFAVLRTNDAATNHPSTNAGPFTGPTQLPTGAPSETGTPMEQMAKTLDRLLPPGTGRVEIDPLGNAYANTHAFVIIADEHQFHVMLRLDTKRERPAPDDVKCDNTATPADPHRAPCVTGVLPTGEKARVYRMEGSSADIAVHDIPHVYLWHNDRDIELSIWPDARTPKVVPVPLSDQQLLAMVGDATFLSLTQKIPNKTADEDS
ncbi:serine/threonine protein kinase (plasmid) [Embleya sp. NBC_00896]|nr:serine/threonine protein kinase [Embleya sp. NBC_00896]